MRVPWQAKFGVLCLVWGASFLLMKIGLGALAPVQVATLRILSGTVTVLVAAAVVRARLPRSRRVWAHMMVVGFALGALPFTLFPLGEERVASALAGIGNATTPLAVVLFTLLLIPAQRVDRRTLLAVVTGFLGVVVIMQPWEGQGRPDLLGFGFTLLAGASYGFGWTYLRRFLHADDVGGLGLPADPAAGGVGADAGASPGSGGGCSAATAPRPGRCRGRPTARVGSGDVLGAVLAVLALGHRRHRARVRAAVRRRPRGGRDGRGHGDLRHPGRRRRAGRRASCTSVCRPLRWWAPRSCWRRP